MQNDKLKQIIERKNERLEEQALREASDIIDEIGKQQARIREANSKIVELRAELKKLEVESVDAGEILGGE